MLHPGASRGTCGPFDRPPLRLALAYSGTNHFEPVTGACIEISTHAADGMQLFGFDTEVLEEAIVHVKTQDFSQYQAGAQRTIADVHDLLKLALHAHVRFA